VPLVPTKAALFGLDLRFQAMEERQQAKKNRRHSKGSKEAAPIQNKNRHLFPSQDTINLFKKTERKREFFMGGTCYDSQITKRLQEKGLPPNVPFLTYKDL
jgi:hypothetical protein